MTTFPILEYDPERIAIINPREPALDRSPSEGPLPERAVLCFFLEVLESLLAEGRLELVHELRTEMGLHPVYMYTAETPHGLQKILVAHPGIGAPLAVGLTEEILAMGVRKLWTALKDGSGQMLNVAATCAAAGIIVGVVAKTGLGLKFSSIVIAYAGGSLPLTALYTALIVWVIGLAVPVTASYIICAVIAAPALTKLGVPDFAAHMFIFYYAVLSEVSPPTALSPFAAAAITGGDPYRTTLQSWKYTLPAFVVPFVFVLDPAGVALLLKVPPDASWSHVAWIAVTAIVGIATLAAGVQKWLLRACSQMERWVLIVCGLMLVYPLAWLDGVGLTGVVVLLAWQWFGLRSAARSRAIP